MAKKLDPADLVTVKELLMANSIQIDALTQLLIEKELKQAQTNQVLFFGVKNADAAVVSRFIAISGLF